MSNQPLRDNKTSQPAPNAHSAPFSVEAEEAFLGGILVSPSQMVLQRHKVNATDFFLLRHQHIWGALCDLHDVGASIDTLTVSDKLKQLSILDQVGGASYIIQLINNTPTSTHTDVYGQILLAYSTRRQMLTIADQVKALAVDEALPVSDALAKAVSAINDIRSYADHYALSSEELADEYERILATQDDRDYQPVGFYSLDRLIKPARKSVTIVGGRAGTGKSAFCMNTALKYAERGLQALYISVESTAREITARFLSIMTGYDTQLIEQPSRMTAEQKQRVAGALKTFRALPISIRNQGGLTPGDVALLIATEAQFGRKPDAVMLDGLYDMELPTTPNRQRILTKKDQYDQIVLALSNMAKETNAIFFLTHQLNRTAENQIPDRSHFLEDGGERNADGVIMLHSAIKTSRRADPKMIEVYVTKARGMGRIGVAELMFDNHSSKFYMGDASKPPSADLSKIEF